MRFDGFPRLTVDWVFGFADWESVDSAAQATTTPPSSDYGMWNRRIEVTGTAWLLDISVTPDAAIGTYAGVYSRQRVGLPEFACYVVNSATGWTLNASSIYEPMGRSEPIAPPQLPVRLRMRKTATDLQCEIPDVKQMTFGLGDIRTSVGLYTNTAAARFHYVEAVRGR